VLDQYGITLNRLSDQASFVLNDRLVLFWKECAAADCTGLKYSDFACTMRPVLSVDTDASIEGYD
jgi:hypothetical protein